MDTVKRSHPLGNKHLVEPIACEERTSEGASFNRRVQLRGRIFQSFDPCEERPTEMWTRECVEDS